MEPYELDGLAELVRRRLAGRIRDLRLTICQNGIVLQGRAYSYYGKHLTKEPFQGDEHVPDRTC